MYIRELVRETHPLLFEQRVYADKNNIKILLPEAANLYQQYIRLKKPRTVLEIGTAIGYSGLIALLNSQANLVTIELDEDTMNVAKGFFGGAGVLGRVIAHLGDAKQIVPMLTGSFDMIFMDGPKSSYIDFLPFLYDLLEEDGILISDNVLFKGWVSGENLPPKHKHNTIIRNLDRFCRAISNHDGLVTSILPIGDGVSVSIKQSSLKT